jgi:hypothetical protein
MAEKETNGLNRREFLRKAAITGAVAWAIPVVQSVAATPAFAQMGSPPCIHGRCVSSCLAGPCNDEAMCETECAALCLPPSVPAGSRACCIQSCLPSNWANCNFIGSTAGCPPT